MSDITMCLNDNCPMAAECYRHEAEPHEYWQSFAAFEPIDGECGHYLPISEKITE